MADNYTTDIRVNQETDIRVNQDWKLKAIMRERERDLLWTEFLDVPIFLVLRRGET